MLPKDLRFEHEDAKLASCSGRHLTSLRPWIWDKNIFAIETYTFTQIWEGVTVFEALAGYSFQEIHRFCDSKLWLPSDRFATVTISIALCSKEIRWSRLGLILYFMPKFLQVSSRESVAWYANFVNFINIFQ